MTLANVAALDLESESGIDQNFDEAVQRTDILQRIMVAREMLRDIEDQAFQSEAVPADQWMKINEHVKDALASLDTAALFVAKADSR